MTGVAVFGVPLDGVDVTPVPPAISRLLALAHERVVNAPAAVHVGDGVVTYIAPSHADAAGLELLDGDVAAISAARAPIVLAGPGVVRDEMVAGLHALAAAAHLGVLNTWGAKGVFDWRSPHHFATVGLQARDFELGGLARSDVIVTTGLDPDEAPPALITGFAPVIDITPRLLTQLGARWSRPSCELVVPPLRSQLAAVTEAGWAADASPLAPTRATRHYAEVFAGCVVAAQPGLAGFWVARTFPTGGPGLVHVAGGRVPDGFAAACALVARLRDPSRPALAVCSAPLADEVRQVVETADRLGAPIVVEVWDPGGAQLAPDEHLRRLRAMAAADRSTVADLATDDRQLGRMIDVAGPIIAWTS